MKKLIWCFACLIIVITNTKCKKSAIEKPIYGTQSNETFYKNDVQINQALTGTYMQLKPLWNEWARNHYFIGDITTDDAWKGGASDADYGTLADLANFVDNPTNEISAGRWSILYNLIARANEVIAYAPKAEGDKSLLARYVLEAKFLRAFGYYNLSTVFGGVPLLLKPVTPSEATATPKASADQVFAQIVADLTDATALPSKTDYSANDQYRVTNGLSWTLMAKTYMFQKNYVKAEEALKNVVQSGTYSLLADYAENWRTENSSESVMEINNQIADKDVPLGTNVPLFFCTRTTAGYPGYGFHLPTQDLFNEFDPADPRITYTFVMNGDRFVGDTPDTDDQNNSLSPSGMADRKILVPQIQRIEYYPWMIHYNIRLIRYADVLLLYAEALNENGKPAEALTYLNQIRARARNTPPADPERSKQSYIPATTAGTLPDVTTTDQSALRQAIWHERRCELGMEGWRRDDLLRQGRFGPVMRAFAAKYNTEKGKNFRDDRDNLLPIPQNEIDYSNETITQNPNY